MFKNITIKNCNAFFSDKRIYQLSDSKSPLDFIVTGGHITWFLRFDHENKSNINVIHTYQEESQIKFVLELHDFTYKIADDGSLRQLLCTFSSTNSSGDCFVDGSSESSSKENFSWIHIENLGLNLICAASARDCLVYIVIESGRPYLKIARLISSQFVYKSSHPIGTSTQNFFLKNIRSDRLSVPFSKHWLAEKVILDHELVIIAQPTGLVSVLPVGSHIPSQEPIHIHFDNERLIFVDAIPSREGLVLVYASGKVVMIFCKKQFQMAYQTHYLSTSVKVAALLEVDGTFRIVWSDGDTVRFTKPVSLEKIDITEGVIPLRGIVEIFKMENRLLYFSSNGIFYEAPLSSFNEKTLLPGDAASVMDEIREVGKSVEEVKTKVKNISKHIEALAAAQINPSEILLTVENACLIAENLSNRCFARVIWSFMVQSISDGKFYVKIFPLESDFAPQSNFSFGLEYFAELGCKFISVSLVGLLVENERRIFVNLGSKLSITAVSSCTNPRDHVREELLEIFS